MCSQLGEGKHPEPKLARHHHPANQRAGLLTADHTWAPAGPKKKTTNTTDLPQASPEQSSGDRHLPEGHKTIWQVKQLLLVEQSCSHPPNTTRCDRSGTFSLNLLRTKPHRQPLPAPAPGGTAGPGSSSRVRRAPKPPRALDKMKLPQQGSQTKPRRTPPHHALGT